MKEYPYRRTEAAAYALEWAYRRNPRYLNFDGIGGDCTNFVSQCIWAGCGVMNYTPELGWFYISSERRTASWTGVEYLYRFLVSNREEGPYADACSLEQVQIGDVIQLGNPERFYHSLLVTGFQPGRGAERILVTTHTFDAMNRGLDSYLFDRVRALHIGGYRA